MTFAVAALAFALGALLSYFWRGAKIAELSTLLSSERSSAERLQNEFRSAAEGATRQVVADALKDFRQIKTESDMNLENKKDLIAISVADMKGRLEEYQKIVRKFEEERHEMYGNLKNSIEQMLSAGNSIRLETAALKKALTSSVSAQGNLGQMLLEEILERNGFVKGEGYDTQVVWEGEEGNTLRPDVVIHLPGNKKLFVDAKAPIGEFLLATETEDPERIKEHYRKLAANIRDNMNRLSKKDYQRLTDSDIRFVLMFVPEGPIRAAFSADPALLQDAQMKNVMLASPMTIIPLIQLIAYSWQQYRLAANAKELGAEVETLGQRLCTFMEYLQDVQQGLKKARDGWNKAVGSWESRMSPQLEKIKGLGGKLKDLPKPEALDQELSESPLQKNSNLLQ